jgi:hypothetical protein
VFAAAIALEDAGIAIGTAASFLLHTRDYILSTKIRGYGELGSLIALAHHFRFQRARHDRA